MIVKYSVLPSITSGQFASDIVGIISGSITNTAGLSAGADTAHSSFTGNYPSSSIITLVNAGSNTFSKVHGIDSGYTHYFRLTFGSSVLTSMSLAQGYTVGTDTLLNSYTQTVNVSPYPYTTTQQFPSTITIVLTSKCVYISSPYAGQSFGIFDLTANGITTRYTSSMKMALIQLQTGSYAIPYTYALTGQTTADAGTSVGYTSLSGNLTNVNSPIPKFDENKQIVMIENPVFIQDYIHGYELFGIYNLFKIPNALMSEGTVYNVSGTRRVVSSDYAIITE